MVSAEPEAEHHYLLKPCTGERDQQFYIKEHDGVRYKNVWSGQCMAMAGAADGTARRPPASRIGSVGFERLRARGCCEPPLNTCPRDTGRPQSSDMMLS